MSTTSQSSPAAAGRSRPPYLLSGGTGGGLRDSDRLAAEKQIPKHHVMVREYGDLCSREFIDFSLLPTS